MPGATGGLGLLPVVLDVSLRSLRSVVRRVVPHERGGRGVRPSRGYQPRDVWRVPCDAEVDSLCRRTCYERNPRLFVPNWPMYGKTAGPSFAATPYHCASVAPYWSTDVVGIHRPSFEASSGPFNANVGKLP